MLIDGIQFTSGAVADEINLRDYSEAHNALGNVSGSKNIDLNDGNVVSGTIVGSTTFDIIGENAGAVAASFTLVLTNGGSATITWPANTKWPKGTAPTLTAAGVDVLSFFSLDGGTTWRGCLAQQDSK